MSDEKNQEGLVDEGTAQRLAEQRKALNLQTRPLEVIADLDWDVDDDDAVFSLPPAAAKPAPTPKKAEEPAKPAVEAAKPAEAAKKAAEPVVSSGGTMMMSAGDFRAALKEENEKIEANAQQSVSATTEAVTENVEAAAAPVADAAKDVAEATAARGGTMLLSGAEMQEAMNAAKIDTVESGAESKQTIPNEPLEGAEEIADSAPHLTASGTMLMSSAAIHAQLEEEADLRSSQLTPAAQHAVAAQQVAQPTEHAPVEPQAPQWGQAPQRQEAVWGNPAELQKTEEQHGISALTSNRKLIRTAITAVVTAIVIISIVMLVVKCSG